MQLIEAVQDTGKGAERKALCTQDLGLDTRREYTPKLNFAQLDESE
ncbi:hypothetical protein GPEL0_01f2987 [Geoanaerobacter pelophilus]|uniref:Uncharacterized protein n=1 Tax=Geoanaerobacter pelophilus TaxID=60036 RepID=A0ABQ0MKD5_9BACT|nr:hypothetical protein GPEL0_01f2987 [Geoanaerobacter pelophilus]